LAARALTAHRDDGSAGQVGGVDLVALRKSKLALAGFSVSPTAKVERKEPNAATGRRGQLLTRVAAAVFPGLRMPHREPISRVDKMPDPQSDVFDEDEAEEAGGGLVLSGRQSSAVFEL
jgi:hypothetical protein